MNKKFPNKKVHILTYTGWIVQATTKLTFLSWSIPLNDLITTIWLVKQDTPYRFFAIPVLFTFIELILLSHSFFIPVIISIILYGTGKKLSRIINTRHTIAITMLCLLIVLGVKQGLLLITQPSYLPMAYTSTEISAILVLLVVLLKYVYV